MRRSQQSPHEALLDSHAKATKVISPTANILANPYDELLNVPMYQAQQIQRAYLEAIENVKAV